MSENEFKMTGEPISYWKKILRTDTGFYANIQLYRFNFHDKTNGIAFRNGKITSTFRGYLLEAEPLGELILEEIERRSRFTGGRK